MKAAKTPKNLDFKEMPNALQKKAFKKKRKQHRTSKDADADVTYQTVNSFSSDKCFIYFHITFDEISATLCVQF